MLRLSGITKNYVTATETVAALRGVSLAFRKNEFVSILGPSGCGKTTLLNLIGGLDRYTGGDLFIGGRSTAEFTDRDWGVYRNHRVGFIFQSYNLIPHQTILGNVELALTIAGVSREERLARAKRTLDRVGLAGMYYKRPNQLSGGQCQRVAIARALVNDPEILLADEPTGALDTVTSGQIMDLIREIAGERLVIMVTHNPELAEEYSTRIVRLLDGQVIEDTNPFSPEEEIEECRLSAAIEVARDAAEEAALRDAGADERTIRRATAKRRERAKMSFFTAFRLSARNLLSKRRRTALVGVAGSIGIIGIAMVLAISAGIRGYVASMQDDMLSGNPITITKVTYDLSAITGMMSVEEKAELLEDHVRVNSLIEYLAKTAESMESLQIHNELTKDYTDYVLSMPEDYRAAIKVNWGMDLSHSIFTSRTLTDGTVEHPSVTSLTAAYTAMIEKTEFKPFASYATSLGKLMDEAPDNPDYILSQYDVLEGTLAREKNEVMLVVSPDTELTDITLAKLGYYTEEQFLNLLYDVTDDERYDESKRKPDFAYSELVGKELVFYPNNAIYQKTTDPALAASPLGSMIYEYANDTAKIAEEKKADGLALRVVGILRPKEDISFGCLTSGLYYTKALADYARSQNYDSDIAKALRESGSDALTGGEAVWTPPFPGATAVPLSLGVSFTYSYLDPTTKTRADGIGFVGGSFYESLDLSAMMGGGAAGGGATGGGTAGGNESGIAFKNPYGLVSLTLADLGGADTPEAFTIYPTDFENKDLVTAWLDRWNSDETLTLTSGHVLKGGDRSHVTYTDTLSLVIELINSMIDVVSTALIAFTSISLVVSTVMIGILTYVSVVERIKEIGVIRSLGGRKKDVRHLFNAETFIIGFLAGLIGVIVTALLALLVNLLIKVLAGVTITAYLPFGQALTLIALSIGLTLISGLMPASAAARKDPVNALRTE